MYSAYLYIGRCKSFTKVKSTYDGTIYDCTHPPRQHTLGRHFDRRFVLMIQRLERTDVVEILERIFDKGIVVDAWARVSLAGIHLATIEARIVMASLETHLEYVTELNDVVAPLRSALDGSQSLSARERASLRIVHKAFDAWNFRDVDGYTALLDNGYVGETHRNPTLLRVPADGRRDMQAYFDTVPGQHFTIESALATGDDVLVSWLTTPPQQRA